MEKNSEDEDGQLEEQIERLQEKVESAQSEQKNLFLVIFQVRPGPCSGSFITSVRHAVDMQQPGCGNLRNPFFKVKFCTPNTWLS